VNTELLLLNNQLMHAKNPENVFGSGSETELKTIFRVLAFKSHPDKFSEVTDKALANETFKLLNNWWKIAQDKLNNKTYGNVMYEKPKQEILNDITISSTKYSYVMKAQTKFAGAISDIYEGIQKSNKNKVLLKISRHPNNNLYIQNEASMLKRIYNIDSSLLALIPECIDTFSLSDENKSIKKINVFNYISDLVSLETVIKRYPNGIDPKDMAWMFKRCLLVLDLIHSNGIIHGAVLPSHILLNLKTHGILLVDWTQSVNINSKMTIIDNNFIQYYPKTILEKKNATKANDIYMLGMTIIKLLGGDLTNKTMPSSVPQELKHLIKACTLGLDNAGELHTEFDERIVKLWGEHKFRDFKI